MSSLTPHQQQLVALWDRHLAYEFEEHDENKTVETMVDDAYVNHVPTMIGGQGREGLRAFYGDHFVHQVPKDWSVESVSRTVGDDRLVDEMYIEFTHSVAMDWLLPGVAPTHRSVKIAVVVVAHFREGRLAHEHIYWDQASVLVQVGLLKPDGLPVAGGEAATKVRVA